MDANEEYIRRSRPMVCVYVYGKERDIDTYTQRLVHALIHKHMTDDEDYEILRNPIVFVIIGNFCCLRRTCWSYTQIEICTFYGSS